MLRDAADRLVNGFDPETVRTVFSTSSRSHCFKGSGDKVRFFLEEDTLDADGNLTRDKPRIVNKIGHAPHDLAPTFEAFCDSPLACLASMPGACRGHVEPGHLARKLILFCKSGCPICHRAGLKHGAVEAAPDTKGRIALGQEC